MYIDDGFSATDTGRYDFEVQKGTGNSYTVNFHTIKDLQNKNGAKNAATISAINFLWASNSGLSTITSVVLHEVGGA